MLSEEEIKSLISKLKVHQRNKTPILYHRKYIQHIIDVLEYVINPTIIKKDTNFDDITPVDIIKEVYRVVADE